MIIADIQFRYINGCILLHEDADPFPENLPTKPHLCNVHFDNGLVIPKVYIMVERDPIVYSLFKNVELVYGQYWMDHMNGKPCFFWAAYDPVAQILGSNATIIIASEEDKILLDKMEEECDTNSLAWQFRHRWKNYGCPVNFTLA